MLHPNARPEGSDPILIKLMSVLKNFLICFSICRLVGVCVHEANIHALIEVRYFIVKEILGSTPLQINYIISRILP